MNGALLAARFGSAGPDDVVVDGADVFVAGELVGDDARDAEIVGGLLRAALAAAADAAIDGAEP